MPVSSQRLVFNGINATTGDYLLPPLTAEVIGKVARGEKLDERHLQELRSAYKRKKKRYAGPKDGVDPNKLEEAGWGVIFAQNASQAVRESLQPLLLHRQRQAGPYFKEFSGLKGYLPGEKKVDFLARHHAGLGPADPDKVPYYLLIVGDPETIPFRFQYQLDVTYAVGRIHFDTPEEYANYAASVIEAETRPLSLSRRAVFFAASNPGDDATSLSASDLVEPLYNKVSSTATWEFDKLVAERATKSALSEVLGGAKTPGFLFSATHGVGFSEGDTRQLPHQGALLCQDWPGPSWRQPIPESFYFSGDDLGDDANPFGLIAFFYACYGAGTPRLDDFAHAAFRETRPVIAPHAFLAGLPQKLLSHPRGGALAVVGHVDRAWSYSFHWEKAGSQVGTFEAALKRILEGRPLGSAVEFFNERYAELSSHLTDELEDIKFRTTPNDYELAGLWTAHNDARSYVIIGDPAVRLAVAPAGQTASPRPALALTQPPARPVSFQPTLAPPVSEGAFAMSDSLASVISATEQRFQARAREKPPVSYAPARPEVIQKNPPQRIRNRLARLGVPEGEIDALFRTGGISYVPFASTEATPSLASVALERIIGRNDLIGVEFLEAALVAARSVGRVLVKARSGRLLGYGSGVMVSPQLLLTNNHVLGSDAVAAASEVEFGYQYESGGRLNQGQRFRFSPEEFFLTDPALDFTLVAVRAVEGLDQFGHVALNYDDGAVLVGEYMNIVQHPNGLPKQLAFRDNQVVDLLDDFVHYRADTERGSSGSPVFNDQWEMVALHHSGVPKRNSQKQILARDGTVWTPNQGDFAIDWFANEGARVGRVLALLCEAKLAPPQARLRENLLSAAASQSSRSVVVSRPVPTQPDCPSARRESGDFGGTMGAVTMTVPLHLIVSLGDPAGVVATPTAAVSRVSPAAEGSFGSGYIPSPAIDRFFLPSLSAQDWTTRLSLALASHLAYAAPEIVEGTARGLWGFETCEFIQANTTRCFIATAPGVVLIAFRGTVDVGNWLANLNVMGKGRPYGTVHRGFYYAFADVQDLLEYRLDDFAGRQVMLTGHSLGGALAGIAAAEWQGTRSIRGIYTYGQPAVGTSGYRDFIGKHYSDSYFRFVNHDDVVPRVPPGYKHVSQLVQFGEKGTVLAERAPVVELSASGPPTMSEREFAELQEHLQMRNKTSHTSSEMARAELEGFWPSIRDHGMDRYIEKIINQIG